MKDFLGTFLIVLICLYVFIFFCAGILYQYPLLGTCVLALVITAALRCGINHAVRLDELDKRLYRLDTDQKA